ncbi:MAG TPA: protein kinase, partial [Kofleriaceae bacterium]|nr:protein kinase [Kofleriaceae bacterium]
GTVYRALDRTTGANVALKVLKSSSQDAVERFVRETRVLEALRHPAIVRYIADGRTEGDELWLAMEWLDGESVAQRLARAQLSVTEGVELVRRIAEALGAAHERGVVHRDVKPSNLWLVDSDLERVKILDFGVARVANTTSTRTGMLIGTPGYMAPEQARGDRHVGPRSDVFALGCLLFECLTGRAPFVGDNVMAVLAKVLLEEAPRVGTLRDDLPELIDDLLARTLSKQPEVRPRDGTELAAELAMVVTVRGPQRAPTSPPSALTSTERRLLCVVLIDVNRREAVDLDATRASEPSLGDPIDSGAHDTLAEQPRPELAALREIAEAHGARLQRLVDGSLVVTLLGSGTTSDQAMQAARCALALHAALGTTPMALATGRGVMAGRWPVGEAIDRATALLADAQRARVSRVRIDEVTAGLLDTRFEVAGDDAGLYVLGERDHVQVTRTLLGKPTPCVGRDRELHTLAGLYDECVGEPLARAVLVTGPAGIGKSRVRFELLRRIAERGEPVEIWHGRGDPLHTAAPFGLIAPALRRAAGIHDGEPLEVRRQKLRARVARHTSMELARTTQFLGELVGVPFPDEDSVELRAARLDAPLMLDQITRAFEHFLAVETSAQTVVIVLEDLHWGDLPTVKLVEAALRALPDRPLFVLALARPEVHELFPRLWHERGVQELRLDELTRRGSERLVRQVLGERASDALVARIVEQSGGNAFYLEELIRAVAEGKGDAMPETVLAVVQGRLERLEVDARRVLRAGSVFGARFWRGGVTKLLGGGARDASVRPWIDELVERELIARVPVSRFPGDDELQFRHAIVREAAYAMLTDADRQLG